MLQLTIARGESVRGVLRKPMPAEESACDALYSLSPLGEYQRRPLQSYRDSAEPKQPNRWQWHVLYQGSVPATESDTYGFSVRVVPIHPCLMQAHELRLITW